MKPTDSYLPTVSSLSLRLASVRQREWHRDRNASIGPLLGKLLGMNWVIVAVAFALSIAGVIAVYSATYFRTQEFWHKQAIWVVVGSVVFVVTSLIDYRCVKWIALPMYLAGTGLVILTYTALGESHGGAALWIRIPGIGLFQPSQMTLVAGILTLGLLLSEFRRRHPMLRLVMVGAVVVGPMLLILKQPDVGMTLVWIPVVLGMLYVGGIPKRYLLSLLLLGVAAIPLIVNFVLKDYQHARILTFLDLELDPRGAGWAVRQSLIAIGSAGWTGKGFLAADTQVKEGLIPATTVHTDYIFTAIAEQFGFVGGVILLALFGILILAMLFTAHAAADELGLLITVGFTAQMFFHVYQNIGMTIALMPITGLPLPFLSYGGTFLVMIMFGLGLVNSVWMHRKELP